MIVKRHALTVLLCLLASACGFQLRGHITLPAGVEPIYIDNRDVNADIYIELRNLLRESGIALTSAATDAGVVLTLDDYDTDRRTIAVGTGARVAEYQLFEEVVYSLRNRRGEILIPPSKLIEQAILANNPNAVVSTGSEEGVLRGDMRRRLAEKIAGQLQAFDYQPPAAPSGDTDETAP